MTYQRGEERPLSKLTEAQVVEILSRHEQGERLRDLHKAFPQCSKVNLHHIVHGRRWQYLNPRAQA